MLTKRFAIRSNLICIDKMLSEAEGEKELSLSTLGRCGWVQHEKITETIPGREENKRRERERKKK